jgi:hypothetical protein
MERMYMAREDKLSKAYEDASHKLKFEEKNLACPELPKDLQDMAVNKGPLRFIPV